MERLYLLDAYALIYRSYYAFMGRPMRNRQGINTSAVFGFTKFLRDILMKEAPRYMASPSTPREEPSATNSIRSTRLTETKRRKTS